MRALLLLHYYCAILYIFSNKTAQAKRNYINKVKKMANPEIKHKKKNKHAPSESSCKEPVSKIRQIPGLDTSKYKESKFGDIRFDPAFGKANEAEVRKNYAFLDNYRQKEIQRISSILKDPKTGRVLSFNEREDLEYQLKALKSKMDSLKNKDFVSKVRRDVKNKYWDDVKEGKQGHYIKRSEQKKMIQVEKFKTMKKSQVDKVIERKRKKRLGKEYKNVEFLKNDEN